jgi:hypothetical protein
MENVQHNVPTMKQPLLQTFRIVVPKLDSAASKGASGVSKGCCKFLETGLLLTNKSQITPVVTGFLCILLQTDSTVLKVAALITVV